MTDSPEQTSDLKSRRWSIAFAGLAALVPIVPIVIGLLIVSGNAGNAPSASAAGFTPVTRQVPVPTTKRAPRSPVPRGRGTLVALVLHDTTMRVAPAGRPLHELSTRTEFGSPEALWVVQRTPGWLGVISPLAGNGRVGWIPESDTSLTRVTWELKVSLWARRLTVLDNGKVLQQYTVAVGAPTAPTPIGRFAVTDRLNTGDPTGPYGCCIVALSAEAPHAIQDWSGGNRIAIHSTPETSSIGEAVSHGCMRLTLPEGRWLMTHVPLGTPTLISS